MTLQQLLELAALFAVPMVGAYAGVRAGIAEIRTMAKAAIKDAARAHDRLDRHLEAHRGD